MQKALGILETFGLLTGIAVADAMVKSADVELIGYELTKGQGMTVIKVQGDVGAVKAAVAAGEAVARDLGLFRSKDVIPRPAENLELLVFNGDTVGILPPAGPGGPAAPAYGEAISAPDATEQARAETMSEVILAGEGENSTIHSDGIICNLCYDPLCPRKPYQPHKCCIHFTGNEN